MTLGGTTVTYPDGVIEDIDTVANDLFARAQVQYRVWRDVALLAGVENTLLTWGKDRSHTANVDLNNGRHVPAVPERGVSTFA